MENRYFCEGMMYKALTLARKSASKGEVPVGAVIVKDDRIISCGENRRELGKNALCHAEIEAINSACKKLGRWRLSDCDIYVTLEPCSMCAGAIINARIKNVYFGAYDLRAGACGTVVDLFDIGLNHKPNVTGGILLSECRAELRAFFDSLRKRNKQNKKAKDKA